MVICLCRIHTSRALLEVISVSLKLSVINLSGDQQWPPPRCAASVD